MSGFLTSAGAVDGAPGLRELCFAEQFRRVGSPVHPGWTKGIGASVESPREDRTLRLRGASPMSPRAGEGPLFSPFSPIHRPNLGGQLKVDLPLSLRLQRMTGNCANRTAGVEPRAARVPSPRPLPHPTGGGSGIAARSAGSMLRRTRPSSALSIPS